MARTILHKANLSCLLLPAEATPEALFDELAGIQPPNFDHLNQEAQKRWMLGRAVAAQRAFMKDEASSIFAAMKKEYMQGLSEMLLQGYDGDAGIIDKRLKSKGIIVVKEPCFSFLGATTPIMYSKHITSEEHENGFAARFAVITPNGETDYHESADLPDEPTEIYTRLHQMFVNTLPWHGGLPPSASPNLSTEVLVPPVTSVSADPDALTQLKEYRRALGWDMLFDDHLDDAKSASYARLGTMAFKVAMLLAAIESKNQQIRIEAPHAYAAQELCERWRESLHR